MLVDAQAFAATARARCERWRASRRIDLHASGVVGRVPAEWGVIGTAPCLMASVRSVGV